MAFVLAIITTVFYKEKVSSSVKFQCLWKYILCLMEDLKKKKKLKVYNLQWNVVKLYKSFWTFNVMKFASMWPHHTKGSLNNTNGWGPMLYPNYILCRWVCFFFFHLRKLLFWVFTLWNSQNYMLKTHTSMKIVWVKPTWFSLQHWFNPFLDYKVKEGLARSPVLINP